MGDLKFLASWPCSAGLCVRYAISGKKHDAGECCELEHVDQEDVEGHTLLGRCSGCTTAVYVGDLPDEEESRLMKGYKFTCRDCKDCGIDG